MAGNNKPSLPSLCSPALLYLFLGVFSLIGMIFSQVKATSIIIQGIFIFIWTWVLNYICRAGHTGISWFLVILPFVITAILMIGFFSTIKGEISTDDIKDIIREVKDRD
jgi:RsiW-degrading membrane proteinase PrsW (M82 family)